jgi:hypothetical protein
MEPQYEGLLDADALHKLAMGVLRAERVKGQSRWGLL